MSVLAPATSEGMPLVEHLVELRVRLTRALSALAVGTVVGYAVFPTAMALLIAPYCDAIGSPGSDPCSLVAFRPLEPFSVRMKTALVIGLFIGGPVIFTQLWRFITPGLTRRERRYALPFVVLSQLMFTFGIGFAYLVIPKGLEVLLGMGGPQVTALLSASEYLSFMLRSAIAFGLVFELPLILVFLSLVGVLEAAALRRARPYAAVAMLAAAAVLTPTTDAVTMLLLTAPMLVFYEISVIAARLIERSRRRRRSTSHGGSTRE